MTAPKRIQLRRTKGWRKPEGTIVVSRPSRWGNPFTLGGRRGLACVPGAVTGAAWEYEDRISAAGMRHDYFHPGGRVTLCTIRNLTRAEAVQLYREALVGPTEHFRNHGWAAVPDWHDPITPDDVRRDLAGKDLACWCPLDQPCHADVLLEIANGGAR
jgi:hypothetical protein